MASRNAMFLNEKDEELKGTQYVGGGGNKVQYNICKIKFNKKLTEATTIKVSINGSGGGAILKIADSVGQGFVDYTVPKDTDVLGLTILWLYPAKNVYLSIQSSTGDTIFYDMTYFDVQIKPIEIIADKQNYNVGEIVTCKIKGYYFDRNPSEQKSEIEWKYSQDIFEFISDDYAIENGSKVRVLKLKAKEDANAASINIEIGEWVNVNDKYGGFIIMRDGTLNISIISPYKLNESPKILCENATFEYRLEKTSGSSVGIESIKWMDNPENLELISGQGTETAIYKAVGTGQTGFVSVSVKLEYVDKPITKRAASFWIGKPKLKETNFSYEISDRGSSLTLALDKKNIEGYYDKLEWVYPSNTSEYEVTKGENDNELIFKTKLKANQTGQAVFKCVASNSCGDAETTHTINISEVDGTSFNKPIGLGILHSLKSVLNISEEAQYFFNGIGNPESKIYFSFELIEDYSSVILNSYLRDLEGNSRKVVLYVYDSNKNLIFTRDKLESPAGDTIKIGIGKYYIVADVIDGNGMIDMNLEYIPGGVGFSGAISVPIDQNGFYFSDFHDTTAYAYHNIIREYSNGGEIFYKVEMPKYAQELDIRVHTLGSLGFQCIHLAHYDENTKEYEILETVMTNPAVDMSVFERYTGYDNMLRRALHPGEVVYIIVECRKNSNQSKDRGPICITIDGWGNRHHPESTDSITVNKASAPEMSEMALLDIDDRLNYVEDTSRTDYYNLYNFQEKDGYWRSLSNAKEAYHNIEITKPLDLIVHHDGSNISNTYIHIVSLKDFNHAIDIGKPMISVRGEDCDYTNPNIPATLKRGQAFVEVKNIQPGKYCIISQGVNMKDNGIIKVNIEAKHPTK